MNKRNAIFLIVTLLAFLSGFSQSSVFKPDTSYTGIKLSDKQSVHEVLGNLDQYHTNDSIYSFKGYIFINDSLGQYIRLVHFPGDAFDQFSRIEVANLTYLPREEYAYRKRFKNFTSETGVAIGITMDKLIKIKGEPLSVSKNGNLTLYFYKITGIDSSPFLTRYNMPEYSAYFYFDNDILVKYDFGFVYP